MNQQEFEKMLHDLLLSVLDSNEVKILSTRYGLGCVTQSIKKAEQTLGISAATIRKIEQQAISKLVNSSKTGPVVDQLSKLNLAEYQTQGVGGYWLLAMQILRYY